MPRETEPTAAEHTAEPWEAVQSTKGKVMSYPRTEPPKFEQSWFIHRKTGKTFVLVADYCREADARRIITAVNGCADIPTEALEAGVVGELLTACEAFADYYCQAGMPAVLTDEDEEDGLDAFDGDEVHNVRLARQAIAVAKEEQS